MKSKIIKVFTLLIILSSFQYSTYGQETTKTVRDLELWSSIGLKYKINKNWALGLEEQLRLKNDISEVDQYFTEFTVKNTIANSFSWGLGLRYIRENDNVGKIQGYENHLRYNLDLGFKHKYNRIGFKYRFRYQIKNELGISEEEGDELDKGLRFKFAIDYNIKKSKLNPYLASEILNDPIEEYYFDKFRLSLGTKYNFKKFGQVNLFYRLERQLNVSYPKTTNIIGVKYNFTLKNKASK